MAAPARTGLQRGAADRRALPRRRAPGLRGRPPDRAPRPRLSSVQGRARARGPIRELGEQGHQVLFFERDVPYYAAHRDLVRLSGGELRLYPSWSDAIAVARSEVKDADCAMVTSYCPDATDACELVLGEC